jgi:Flp pilus assembly protein TadG
MLMRTLLQKLQDFRRNERGVAAVEFALIMPFLLTLYFGSMEASALFTVDKRVNTISATVGDLVAQTDPDAAADTDPDITQATLTNYFNAAAGIISPYSKTGLKQVVSLVYVKSDGTTKIVWSKANGTGAVARTAGQAFTPLSTSSVTDTVARGGCIVAAETTYSYKPLLGQVFTTSLTLSHTNYFVPRYGATNVITLWDNNTSLATTACSTGP